jgi:streptogramin lyase
MLRKSIILVPLALAAVFLFGALAAAAPPGNLTEFSAGLNPGSAPFRIVSGPDGNLWFTDQGAPKAIGRITPDGTISEIALPSTSSPRQIRVGADGNIWYTDVSATAPLIGRVNSDGTITTFPLPPLSSPNALAVGDDNAFWITDRGQTPAIRRLTTDGTLTSYSVGLNAGSLPNGIAPGSDGALWFTDQGPTKAIGRITLDGTITETNVGLSATSNPAAISPAADGNMYFSDQGTPKAIGKVIVASGTITETALAPTSSPQEITPGADGNLWFTDRGAVKQLGRVEPDGTVTLHPEGIPTSSNPGGVRTGPDGNLWFVDNGAPQQLARYGVGAPAASVAPPAVVGGGGFGVPQTCASGVWSDWAGAQPSFTRFGFDGFRWLRDGSPIAGETASTYTPGTADLGHQLACSQTGTYTLFPVTASATSAPALVRDVRAPLLTLPGTITTDSTSPAGAVVSFATSASDDVDTILTVNCSPASGATFPIGTTTVTCSSTDAAGNTASASFQIAVKGAAAQLADLVVEVHNIGRQQGLEATVAVAQLFVAHGSRALACLTLVAFNVEVRSQQAGRRIAKAQADTLVADANRIRATLGC